MPALTPYRGAMIAGAAVAAALTFLPGCFGSPGGANALAGGSSDAFRRYPLGTLPTSTVTIDGNTFRVWLAQEFDPNHPGVQEEGLMYVRPDEIADDQGMLFVFSDERVRGFWMRNTITPLDIAFARFDGTIVKIWQMPALTWQTFSSVEPALFALEVKQGTFARLGVQEGDRLAVPDQALVPAP
jgi:uncharacterized membrane protein (UPF0127 family)